MKLKRFIEMLSEYPMDMEVQIGDKYSYGKDIFKIGKPYLDDVILISPLQSSLEEISNDDENYEKVSYNMDDTFSTYSHVNGDVVKGKYDDFKVMIKAEEVEYDDGVSYNDPSFSHVGGLIKFLSAFPDETPINIRSGEAHTGVIHEIQKHTIEYC